MYYAYNNKIVYVITFLLVYAMLIGFISCFNNLMMFLIRWIHGYVLCGGEDVWLVMKSFLRIYISELVRIWDTFSKTNWTIIVSNHAVMHALKLTPSQCSHSTIIHLPTNPSFKYIRKVQNIIQKRDARAHKQTNTIFKYNYKICKWRGVVKQHAYMWSSCDVNRSLPASSTI